MKLSFDDKKEIYEKHSEGFKYIPFEKDQQGSYTMDQLKLLITQSSAADPLLQLWQKSLSSSVASFISSSVYALL